MSKYTITQLIVYPIKSLGGVSLQKAKITASGLAYDRFWMLVDEKGRAVTQREIPKMALFQVKLKEDGVQVQYQDDSIHIPFEMEDSSIIIHTKMFSNNIIGIKESNPICAWFSRHLGKPVFLVRPSEEHPRFQNQNPDALVHFPDSSPYLILGESAMKNLNDKLDVDLPINRFRANIIFSGGTPHIEDTWTEFSIGKATFLATKPCARCVMTTISQEDATMTKEPLRTMTTYRKEGNAVLFGHYLKLKKGLEEVVEVGQTIEVL